MFARFVDVKWVSLNHVKSLCRLLLCTAFCILSCISYSYHVHGKLKLNLRRPTQFDFYMHLTYAIMFLRSWTAMSFCSTIFYTHWVCVGSHWLTILVIREINTWLDHFFFKVEKTEKSFWSGVSLLHTPDTLVQGPPISIIACGCQPDCAPQRFLLILPFDNKPLGFNWQ